MRCDAIFDYKVFFPQSHEEHHTKWTTQMVKRLLIGVRYFDEKGLPLTGNPSFIYYGMGPDDQCWIEVDEYGAYTYKDVNPEVGSIYCALKTYTTGEGVSYTFKYDTVFFSEPCSNL